MYDGITHEENGRSLFKGELKHRNSATLDVGACQFKGVHLGGGAKSDH